MKYIFEFLSDKKLLVGIGIGIIISAVIMTGVKINYNVSETEIYKKAKNMGMDYPDNFKVIDKGGEKK